MIYRSLKFNAGLVALTLMMAGSSLAETFFVSPVGSDSNPGTFDRPWKTISHGARTMGGGDTLNVRGGTYTNAVTRDWKAGTPAAPTVVQAYNGETVVCKPYGNSEFFYFGSSSAHDIVISGFKVDAVNLAPSPPAIKITEGAYGITLTNCEIYNVPSSHGVLIAEGNFKTYSNKVVNCVIHDISIRYDGGSDDHGIYLSGTVYGNVIEGNTIYNCKGGGNTPHGIHQFSGDGTASNIYRNNTIYNTGVGIGLYSTAGTEVYNNVIYNNFVGIIVKYGSSNNRIYNNTLDQHLAAIGIGSTAGPNQWIANNLITGSLEQPGITISSGVEGVFLSNNVSCDNPAKNGSGNVGVNFLDETGRAVLSGNRFGNEFNAGFVNPASGDYRLLASSSAIGAGIPLAPLFATDKNGSARPQSGPWTAGAYESGSGTPVNNPPSVSTLGEVTINRDSATPPIPFTVSDVETPADNLTVTGSSALPSLVPDGNIVFGGSGNNRTVTVTPTAGASGVTLITITVSDGSNPVIRTFQITVLEPVVNAAPGVSAGPNQTLTLPSAAALSGVVSDDGLPSPPGAVTLTWSTVSGPGTVTFGNAAAAVTTASFPTAGTYLLRLAASDGELSSSSDLTLTVNPAASGNAVLIPIEAESGTLISPMTVLTDTNGPGLLSEPVYVTSPTADSGTASYAFVIPTAGDYTVWCRNRSAAATSDSFYVAVDGGAEEPYITSDGLPQPDWIWTRVNRRAATPQFAVTPRVLSLGTGPHLIVFRSREANTVLDKLLITNDPNFVPSDLIVLPTNRPPTVYVGADHTVVLPAPAVLSATITDDGLPLSPRVETILWSAVSGPGSVTFGNATEAVTTASFPTAGTYVLRLVASDNALSSSSNVTITVNPATTENTVLIPIEAEAGTLAPPMTVLTDTGTAGLLPDARYVLSPAGEAGTASYTIDIPMAGDYTIWCRTRPASADQDSFYVAVDGGQEEPYIASEGFPQAAWIWTRVNRRAAAPEFAVAPRIFSLGVGPHIVVFRSREANTLLDKLVITNDPNFVPAGSSDVVNQPPAISLEPGHTVTLPSSVSLAATVIDDGLPTPLRTVTTVWSSVSGPGMVTFGNAGAVDTTASFPTAGTYVFRLTASDGALSSSSDVTITVNPAATENAILIPIEAEAGTLAPPMMVLTDPGTASLLPDARYVSSPTGELGTASYTFDVPTTGDYTVWCRTRPASADNDSFYVAVDGGREEPYITSDGLPQPDWIWTRVNRRAATPEFAVTPRIFNFAPGLHTIVFRSREANTVLDKFVITSDPNFVPLDSIGPINQPPASSLQPAQTVTLFAPGALSPIAPDNGLRSSPGVVTTGGPLFGGSVSAPSVVAAVAPPPGSLSGFNRVVGRRPRAFDKASTTHQASMVNAVDFSASTFTNILIEAEDGSLIGPIAVNSETDFSTNDAGQPSRQITYVASSSPGTGSVHYTFDVPTPGDYRIWCRVLTLTAVSATFSVSVDGGPGETYIASDGVAAAAWKWTRVNRRVPSTSFSVAPRPFNFSSGTHSIHFGLQGDGTFLDKLLITDDPDFVPTGCNTPAIGPRISSLSVTPEGLSFQWPSVPGRTYRVYFKSVIADPQWIELTGNIVADGTTASFADPASSLHPQRIYSVYVVP